MTHLYRMTIILAIASIINSMNSDMKRIAKVLTILVVSSVVYNVGILGSVETIILILAGFKYTA